MLLPISFFAEYALSVDQMVSLVASTEAAPDDRQGVLSEERDRQKHLGGSSQGARPSRQQQCLSDTVLRPGPTSRYLVALTARNEVNVQVRNGLSCGFPAVHDEISLTARETREPVRCE